jgi:hypothetical protein
VQRTLRCFRQNQTESAPSAFFLTNTRLPASASRSFFLWIGSSLLFQGTRDAPARTAPHPDTRALQTSRARSRPSAPNGLGSCAAAAAADACHDADAEPTNPPPSYPTLDHRCGWPGRSEAKAYLPDSIVNSVTLGSCRRKFTQAGLAAGTADSFTREASAVVMTVPP